MKEMFDLRDGNESDVIEGPSYVPSFERDSEIDNLLFKAACLGCFLLLFIYGLLLLVF